MGNTLPANLFYQLHRSGPTLTEEQRTTAGICLIFSNDKFLIRKKWGDIMLWRHKAGNKRPKLYFLKRQLANCTFNGIDR